MEPDERILNYRFGDRGQSYVSESTARHWINICEENRKVLIDREDIPTLINILQAIVDGQEGDDETT